MSSAAWRPVVERLAIDRRVIAFDLPGFGGSPMLAPLLPPTPALLAEGLAQQLQELNIALPVDLVGNSLGGYVALEAAKQGTARSVVALSPAGLWAEDHHDRKTRLVFAATRTAAVRWPLVTRRILMTRPGRTLLLAIPASARGWRIPACAAVEAAEELAASPGFDTTLDACGPRFLGGQSITCPVRVAFGSRDLLLRASKRRRDQLPSHTIWAVLPGCGHVPMWDDPAAVVSLILDGIR